MSNRFERACVAWASLFALPLWSLVGCTGSGDASGGGGGGGGGGAARVISFNTSPDTDLAATADDGEGGEYAVYGEKDADGELASVEQVDLALAGGTTVSVELDENGQPVYVTSSDGGEATFTYDEDVDTVLAEVTTSDGATTVTETTAVGTGSSATAKARPLLSKSQDEVCDNLDMAIAVLEAFFSCDGADDGSTCDDSLAEAAAQLEKLCSTDFSEVEDLESSLGDEAADIALGVKAFYTARPASGEGTTLILTATPFGGTRPYDVEWSFVAGDATAEVENLPGGAAVADVLSEGSYIFDVFVTDGAGATIRGEVTFTTDTTNFTDILVSSAYPTAGESVLFTALGADGPAASDSNRFSYLWNFGDGSTGEGDEVEHAFDENGEYIVVVVGTSEGGQRTKGSVVIHVDDDADCKDVCFDTASDAYYDCLLGGGGEDDCASAAHATLEECAVAECGEEFDCAKICHQAAQDVYEACAASGLTDTDCEQEALESLDGCLTEQCSEVVSCEELCAQGAGAIYDECLAAGGGEEDCASFEAEILDECVQSGCEAARDCQDQCAGQAERGFKECLSNGGNELECAARARTLAESCLLNNCEETADCAELCGSEAHRVYDQCIAKGGTEDSCILRADDFYLTCQDEHCEDDSGDCEVECAAAADAMISACIAAGGLEDDCIGAAEDDFVACVELECGLESDDESDCADECAAAAELTYGDCLAAGGTEDGCLSDYDYAFDVCFQVYCTDEGDDGGDSEDDCTTRCAESASAAETDCLAVGTSAEECGSLYHSTYNACVETSCGG